jgi:hypothetical protein
MSEFMKLVDDLNAAQQAANRERQASLLAKAHGIIARAIGKESARDICHADHLLRRAAKRMKF